EPLTAIQRMQERRPDAPMLASPGAEEDALSHPPKPRKPPKLGATVGPRSLRANRRSGVRQILHAASRLQSVKKAKVLAGMEAIVRSVWRIVAARTVAKIAATNARRTVAASRGATIAITGAMNPAVENTATRNTGTTADRDRATATETIAEIAL